MQGNTSRTGWHFAQVPIWMICDDEISDGAKALFAYLQWRQGRDAACWPAISTMAHDMHVSSTTIKRRLHELVEHGYVIKTQRTGKTTLYKTLNEYYST